MPINAADVQIMRPERVSDQPDGGGQMTGVAIATNEINSLWDDVPRTALANGGVSIRKLFCAIRSANTDKFLGAHAMIAQDASATNVSTVLVDTGDHYDERINAKNAIEQYVVMSTRSALQPVGTQRAGQKTILMYSETGYDTPEVGEVMVLMSAASSVQQSIKINSVESRPTRYTYTDNGQYKSFSAVEYTLGLTQALENEFPGLEPAPGAAHPTELFKTQQSDSARYYGIKPVTAAITNGSRSLDVEGIFSPIVPVGSSDTSLVDQSPGLVSRVVQPCGGEVSFNLGNLSGRQTITLPSAFVPGGLRLVVAGSEYRDAGDTLRLVSGADYLSDVSIDAVAGRITCVISGSRQLQAFFIPGAPVELTPYTDAIAITAGNRQLTYTAQLSPTPMPGSLVVSYVYQGRWYSLRDDGTGALIGTDASGSINYTSGSLTLALPVQPDENSKILFSWSRSPYRVAVNNIAGLNSALVIELPQTPAPQSVTVRWSRGSSQYSATQNNLDQLVGDGSGDIAGSRIVLRPDVLPDAPVTVEYKTTDEAVNTYDQALAEITGQDVVIDVGVANIIARSVWFSLTLHRIVRTTIDGVTSQSRIKSTFYFRGRDDGALYIKNPKNILQQDVVGVINEAAGTITIDGAALQYVVRDVVYPAVTTNLGGAEFLDVTREYTVEAQTARVHFADVSGTASPTVSTLQLPLADIDIQIPVTDDVMVPGALLCRVGNDQLVDRGDGVLVRDWNAQTGAGEAIGECNYASGEVFARYDALRPYISNLDTEVQALACGVGAATAVKKAVFRTIAAPLRPSGLQFLARRVTDTALLRADSANDGSITGAFDANDTLDALPQPTGFNGYSLPIAPRTTSAGTASGTVDYDSGLVEITFSQPVILSSLTYNAVAFNTIPLDPSVLGIDPVKLPANGLVPIFKPGNTVVVHNTQSIALAAPAAGAVIDCSRTNLAHVDILDANKKLLAAAQYAVDKTAGTVTLADPFAAVDADGASLTLPLSVNHRIENMAVLSDADISGRLQLMTEVTHDYPQADTYVSSAILFGDLQARVWAFFTQKIDDGGFSDVRNGEDSVAKYDDLNNPILISNQSAVQERWKILFTNNSQFVLIGETLGVIGNGSTTEDFAPINPNTGQPFFTIRAAGWGSGWVSSNVLRFNTDAAAAPVWAVRTVLPSAQPIGDDVIALEFRGDAD